MQELKNQACPFCQNKSLTLIEQVKNMPNIGKCYILSMNCSSCNYYKSDIELERKQPTELDFKIKNKNDLKTIVIKSSEATLRVPQLKITICSGPDSTGYVCKANELMNKFKKILEEKKEDSEDDQEKKSIKNLLKKLWKIELGEQELNIIMGDPSGNSAIIPNKTK